MIWDVKNADDADYWERHAEMAPALAKALIDTQKKLLALEREIEEATIVYSTDSELPEWIQIKTDGSKHRALLLRITSLDEPQSPQLSEPEDSK